MPWGSNDSQFDKFFRRIRNIYHFKNYEVSALKEKILDYAKKHPYAKDGTYNVNRANHLANTRAPKGEYEGLTLPQRLSIHLQRIEYLWKGFHSVMWRDEKRIVTWKKVQKIAPKDQQRFRVLLTRRKEEQKHIRALRKIKMARF